MTAFEKRVAPTNEQAAAFMADCLECFASAAGKRVLSALVAAAHPLEHTPGMTEHEHGRREVVATLWRFGASSPSLPPQTQTPPTT